MMEPDNFFMAWFDRLRKAVDESGVTRRSIADRFDVSTQTLYNWLNGKTQPEVETALEICRICKVPANMIFDDSLPEPGTDLVADTLRQEIQKIGQREALRRILLTEGQPETAGGYRILRTRDETHLEQLPSPPRNDKRAKEPGRKPLSGPGSPVRGAEPDEGELLDGSIGGLSEPGSASKKRNR